MSHKVIESIVAGVCWLSVIILLGGIVYSAHVRKMAELACGGAG